MSRYLDRPDSYASDERQARYLADMRQRARLRFPDRPPVYLAAHPSLAAKVSVTGLEHRLAPCRVLTFGAAFPGGHTDYLTGWDALADELAGLVVVVDGPGRVGRALLREITDAGARGIPTLAMRVNGLNLVPLVETRFEVAGPNAPGWLAGWLAFPRVRHNRPTLAATLAAMGARGTGRAAA